MLSFSHPSKLSPILIYDSGVGGLAIAQALREALPQESIHYIADTKQMPYGDKSSSMLYSYIKQVVHFCCDKRYKLLVMACNTATAASLHFLPSYLQSIGQTLHIVNVIGPVVAYLHKAPLSNVVALLGTAYTISDGIYTQRCAEMGRKIFPLATPLLASMVEHSFEVGHIEIEVLHSYLRQLPAHVDQLLPACTHYLFLQEEFKRFFWDVHHKTIQVVNVVELTLRAVKHFLRTNDLLNTTTQRSPDCFMATALTPAFQYATQQLFEHKVVEINLEDYAECKGAACAALA